MRRFTDLDQREILALAISLEEEHSRIYADYAAGLSAEYPATAKVFSEIGEEESAHRRWLIELFQKKFGNHIPLIRRHDVAGLVRHDPIWMVRPLGIEKVRHQAEEIEEETREFYASALKRATDADIRRLLGDLMDAESRHIGIAQHLSDVQLTTEARSSEAESARRSFVLQYVQPGLNGLIDGSISTLAPIFAAAFATHNTWQTFLVGIAASIGAGISMAFAEALSDDGQISGRGNPWLRGSVTGVMTTAGGLGHTLPYLISDFRTATTIAIAVVFVELWIIAGVRSRFMDTAFWRAAVEVVAGGLIVFGVGILIGSA
ncbi:MAG: ferritin family protein [Hyphomicrobium sp.]|uniref:iron exporter MbfA n=1 Tax=Hyphomicrobium sp. TaxID=82 RepID=UPI0039E40100